jgi:hypothetical protein
MFPVKNSPKDFHRNIQPALGVESTNAMSSRRLCLGGGVMVSKCANPSCSAAFRFLHEGRVFRVETRSESLRAAEDNLSAKKAARHLEFFWLCERCASLMTLAVEKGGVTVRPRLQAMRAAS